MNTDETADYLESLRADGRVVETLPGHLLPLDMASAYATQDALVARRLARLGGKTCGYKVAVTNEAAQAMLGVPHPVYGQLLEATVFDDGHTAAADAYVVRVIECEFGFRLGRDVPTDTQYDAASIADYVDCAVPAIELVEFHFAGIDRYTSTSLAADNAIHGAWVRGAACTKWRDIDYPAVVTSLEVNGATELEGAGHKVLGNPLSVLAWLANTLPQYGHALSAGDYVTTGVTTDAVYFASAGDTVTAHLGPVGSVTLRFEP